jgi:serine/threonine-protein kinase
MGERMLSKAESLVGRQLAGYRLLEILGRGGMSIVFLAERLDHPQERVAIKVLMLSHVPTSEEFLSFQTRFLREAQTVHQLHHEHILPVLGYGEVDDILYMIMPLITGATLAELLALKHGPLPFAEIAGYLNQLASAIDYAHQHGFLHRDIKPSNVLLDEQGEVYLVDFGIAHLFDSGLSAIDEAPTSLTTTGKIYGTPAYMAPERFKGEQAEPATDIYALGILLYQLVTGQVPFKADSPLVVGMKHLNEMPLSPRSLRPDLPEPAEAAILRALAKQPADRFATASALAAAFDAGIKGQWTAGLLPLPPFQVESPDLVDTQEQQAQLAPVVPLPEGPFQSNQLLLGPAFASVNSGVPIADELTQANSSPIVQSRSRERSGGRLLLLTGTILIAVVLLVLLPLLGIQRLYSSPGTEKQVLPTSTSKMPTRTGVTPASSVGMTPTLSAQRTPTSGVTPTSSPKTTPTPTPSPTPSPSSSPTPTPTPTPTLSPTPTPKPTP